MGSIEAARRSQAAHLQTELVCEDEPQRHYTQVHHNLSRCPHLSDGAFRTYVNIKSHYWGRGSCFPGLDLLAAYQGVSRRTIQSNIGELKAAGLLRVTQRGLGLTNLYTIPSANGWTAEGLERWKAAQRAQSGSVLHVSNGVEAGFTSGVEAGFTSGCEASFPLRRNSRKKTQKEEDTVLCAASAAPPATTASNGHSKRRERACRSPEEEQQREELMQIFNDRLRPIDCKEWGRCRREMLDGLREHGFEHMAGCMRAMSTARRFVLQSYVTPITVVRNVLSWEDAGRPRQWVKVEEFAAHKVQQQGGAR